MDTHAALDKFAVSELFNEQRRLVLQFFDTFDVENLKNFSQCILNCPGTTTFTGVGKSGFICQKISASLTSIGIRSNFLDPLSALHGDVGGVRADDIVILFSKSGSTEELVRLVPMLRRRECKIIAVTCSSQNTLSKISDMHVHLPLEKELCAFNLAPVTSTVLQLIFGDTVTALLMHQIRLSKEAYAMNHPAGSIGRKLLLNVEDVMIQLDDVPRVAVGTCLGRVVVEMSRGGAGCVVILDNDDCLCGIFTDGDLRRLICDDRFNLSVSVDQCMTANVRTVQHGMKLSAAKTHFFHPWPVSVLPVLSNTSAPRPKVVGLILISRAMKSLE